MYKYLFLFIALVMINCGCKKTAGEGGTSTITGKIVLYDYNGSFPFFADTLPAQEQDVYIIYGDAVTGFDDRTRTSYDGSFRFDYLRKGDYRIFVYTDDTANQFSTEQLPVIRDVTISKNKSTVEVPGIIIVKM